MEALTSTACTARTDIAAQVSDPERKLAEFCGKYPDRFVAFASLALQYPDLAVQQLEEGVKKFGLKGAAIGGSVAGVRFSDAKFHPVWAKAQELGAVLFIHPQSTPELAERLKGNGWLSNVIGNPLDTTIALSHLIFDGTLDRFPASRSARPTAAASCRPTRPIGQRLSRQSSHVRPQHLAQEEADRRPEKPLLRHARVPRPRRCGILQRKSAEPALVGTDNPIPWQTRRLPHTRTARLSDAEKRDTRGNAAKLLGIKL